MAFRLRARLTRVAWFGSLAMACLPSAFATLGEDESPAAPGTFVWVGDHRLHLDCRGEGSPTVVFDAGLGGSSLDWSRVQPRVADFTRACTYDRAGYGWSDAGPSPRDSLRITRELERLLGNASVAAPYVLVGHSFGGFNVRLFSHNNPERVAGLVLIDPSHEDLFRRFEVLRLGSSAPRNRNFLVSNVAHVPDAMPDDLESLARRFAVTRSSSLAFRSELRHLRQSASQMRHSALPDVPVIVISHRIDVLASDSLAGKRANAWIALQSELARRARQGRHVIADTDDHYVHLRQPGVVIDAIRHLVHTARTAGVQP